jgi:hypothetical protein
MVTKPRKVVIDFSDRRVTGVAGTGLLSRHRGKQGQENAFKAP